MTPATLEDHPATLTGKSIGIVEDDPVIRSVLAGLLRNMADVASIQEWCSAEACLNDISSKAPDLLLVDLELPGTGGIDLIQKIRNLKPDTVCVVVTSSTSPLDIMNALKAGASGYVCKQAGAEELMANLRNLITDGVTLSPMAARLLVGELDNQGAQPGHAERLARLTTREMDVLKAISTKGNAKDAGNELGLSHETVRVHMKKIYQKLHVRCKAEAVALFAQSCSPGNQDS